MFLMKRYNNKQISDLVLSVFKFENTSDFDAFCRNVNNFIKTDNVEKLKLAFKVYDVN